MAWVEIARRPLAFEGKGLASARQPWQVLDRLAKRSALLFQPNCLITRAMLAKVCSAAVNGIEAYPVEVEVNAGYGDTIIVLIETI